MGKHNDNLIKKTEELEEELHEMTKELSFAIAHQIRNPLNNISSSIYLLKDLISDKNPKIQEHLADIEGELNRATKIVNNFLNFSRPSKGLVEEDVHLIINQTLDLIRETTTSQGIDIKKEFAPNLPKITMDVDQMKEVFLNIVLNAQEAMAKGGCLTVTTNLNKDYIHIAFADTGVGIPEEKIEQVFDPYYTTKAKGMGLGLSIAQRVIETHYGLIGIESKTGKGTTVKIDLPINKRGEFNVGSKEDISSR